MATLAHCAYCFESLSASFEKRKPRSLQRTEELWFEYTALSHDRNEPLSKRGASSRSLNPSSDSSSPASSAAASSTSSTPAPLPSSSNTSTSSLSHSTTAHESHPLFITWNTLSSTSHSLRGCIGCFTPLALPKGLHDYALTAAFEDHRFSPVPASLLPQLQVCVTLLTNFSAPDRNPLNWIVGEHGIRLSFTDGGRRYGATYLPDVAREQGWDQEEAVMSLMKKAGWSGRKDRWREVKGMEIVRYEGKKISLDYADWKAFRDWAEGRW